MIKITVTKHGDTNKGWSYAVRVEDQDGATEHSVTLTRAYYETLADGRSQEELIEDSFNFLLEREPKEQILPMFDLSLISAYFPEYESRIRKQ